MTRQAWLEPDLVGLRKAVWCASREVISQALKSWGCLLLLVVSLGLSAQSQQLTEPPNSPSFNKKLFIVELSTYTTMNVLDGITTAQSIHKGYVEGNFSGGEFVPAGAKAVSRSIRRDDGTDRNRNLDRLLSTATQ